MSMFCDTTNGLMANPGRYAPSLHYSLMNKK